MWYIHRKILEGYTRNFILVMAGEWMETGWVLLSCYLIFLAMNFFNHDCIVFIKKKNQLVRKISDLWMPSKGCSFQCGGLRARQRRVSRVGTRQAEGACFPHWVVIGAVRSWSAGQTKQPSSSIPGGGERWSMRMFWITAYGVTSVKTSRTGVPGSVG